VEYHFPLDSAASAKLARELAHIPPLLAQARGNLTGNARDLWKASVVPIGEQHAALLDLRKRAGADPTLGRRSTPPLRPLRLPRVGQSRGAEEDGSVGCRPGQLQLVPEERAALSAHMGDEAPSFSASSTGRMPRCARGASQPRAAAAHRRASPREYERQATAAVDSYLRFLDRNDVLTIKPYMRPALMARIGSYVPPAEQNFFHIAMHRAPTTLWTHFYHWWDLARMAEAPHPSPIRSAPLLYNIWVSRAEGMATAMEEMMLHAGLYDDDRRAREIVWIMQAQRAARGLASLYAHANLIDLDLAMKMQVARRPTAGCRRRCRCWASNRASI
jgi:hypothetical protein